MGTMHDPSTVHPGRAEHCVACNDRTLFRPLPDGTWFCTVCGMRARAAGASARGAKARGPRQYPVPPLAPPGRSGFATFVRFLSVAGGILVAIVAALMVYAGAQPDRQSALVAPNTGPQANTAPVVNTTPVADRAGSQQGDVHLCLFSDYDATAVQCQSDDAAVDLTHEDQMQLIWPPSKGGTDAATIQVLQQDGTGTWQVIASAAPDPAAAAATDGSAQSETIQTLFLAANVQPHCDAPYLIRVVNDGNHRFGQAPLTTTC